MKNHYSERPASHNRHNRHKKDFSHFSHLQSSYVPMLALTPAKASLVAAFILLVSLAYTGSNYDANTPSLRETNRQLTKWGALGANNKTWSPTPLDIDTGSGAIDENYGQIDGAQGSGTGSGSGSGTKSAGGTDDGDDGAGGTDDTDDTDDGQLDGTDDGDDGTGTKSTPETDSPTESPTPKFTPAPSPGSTDSVTDSATDSVTEYDTDGATGSATNDYDGGEPDDTPEPSPSPTIKHHKKTKHPTHPPETPAPTVAPTISTPEPSPSPTIKHHKKTKHPTHSPIVSTPDPTRAPTAPTPDPTMDPTRRPSPEPTTEAWGDKVKDEEARIIQLANDNTAEALGGIIFVFGIIGMLFTATQLFEHPDGLCASCCRLSLRATSFIMKILCLPCRLCCGRYNGYTSSDPRERTVFVEQYTNDLELT